MELIPENDPRLKIPSSPWDYSPNDLHNRIEIVAAMIETMIQNRGVGLAAPQVGINKRLFVIEADGSRFPCFNPEIISVGQTVENSQEGCLSFPKLWMKVSRSTEILCSFEDVNGNKVTKKFDGLAARCYQHELEHLNGICFVDVVSPLVLNMAKKRRAKHRKNT